MNSLFILSFALIQLWEGAIWENPQSSFVAVILLSLWLQPLVQTYGAYQTKKSVWIQILVWLYTGTFIYAIYRVVTGNFSVSSGPNCHLVWQDSTHPNSFVGSPVLAGFYLFGLLFPLIYTGQYVLLAIGLVTLLVSFTYYQRTGEASSIWCYSAILYSLAAIFVK